MEGKKFSTPLADIEIKNGIVYAMHSHAEVTVEHARKHVQLMKENLAPLAPFLMVADINNSTKSISKEVRDCLNDKELERMSKASALIANSLLTRLAGSLYLKFARILTPISFFSNEDEARMWLMQYK